MFDNFNVNLPKNEGFQTYIPCIPIPEYGKSNAPLNKVPFLSLPEANDGNTFFFETHGIVVKGARNCGYAQMEVIEMRGMIVLCLVSSNYRALSHDVTAAMLVFQNKEIAAMMVYQTNPPEIELHFYANTFLCFSDPIWLLVT